MDWKGLYDLLVRHGIIRDTTPIEVKEESPENCLVIDNFAFPLQRRIDDPACAVHNAKEALMTILRHPAPGVLVEKYGLRPGVWQDWMMFLIPHVSKRFGANRYEVLESWMRDWAPSIMTGESIPIHGYDPNSTEPTITATQALQEWERKTVSEREVAESYRRTQETPFISPHEDDSGDRPRS